MLPSAAQYTTHLRCSTHTLLVYGPLVHRDPRALLRGQPPACTTAGSQWDSGLWFLLFVPSTSHSTWHVESNQNTQIQAVKCVEGTGILTKLQQWKPPITLCWGQRCWSEKQKMTTVESKLLPGRKSTDRRKEVRCSTEWRTTSSSVSGGRKHPVPTSPPPVLQSSNPSSLPLCPTVLSPSARALLPQALFLLFQILWRLSPVFAVHSELLFSISEKKNHL